MNRIFVAVSQQVYHPIYHPMRPYLRSSHPWHTECFHMTKQSAPKTNAMRALDARRIPYATFSYPDTIHSAAEVAHLLGVPADHVFKTLVVIADGTRNLLVVAPGDRELDMRLVARSVSAKSAHMALQRDAERLSGLKVGGI